MTMELGYWERETGKRGTGRNYDPSKGYSLRLARRTIDGSGVLPAFITKGISVTACALRGGLESLKMKRATAAPSGEIRASRYRG